MTTKTADPKNLDEMKSRLNRLETHTEAMKDVLQKITEIDEIFQKFPDILFKYRWLFGEKEITAGDISLKLHKFGLLMQIKKQIALKIAECYKLKKEIKELEEKK